MGMRIYLLFIFLIGSYSLLAQEYDSLVKKEKIVISQLTDTTAGVRLDSLLKPRLWALALPMNLTSDTNSYQGLDIKWIANNKMATKFYSGFRVAVDSMNRANQNIQLFLVEHDEINNVYRVQDDPYSLLYTYSPKEFMDICNRLGVEKIIGPFRSRASEILSTHSIKIPVINPVSRVVNVLGNPLLVAAAPSRVSEAKALGRRAAIDKGNNDSSITVLLLTESSVKMKLHSSFIGSYGSVGRDVTEVIIQEIIPESDFIDLSSRGPKNKLIRYVFLDNDVLMAAQLLTSFRARDANLTEFWTLGSVLKSSALDSYLLLRQPIVWAQTERADYIRLENIYNTIKRVSKMPPSRWEWLGYDMAWYASYMRSAIPMAFVGPRRLYVWSHNEADGYVNESALMFKFDKLGVRVLDDIPQKIRSEQDSLMINQ